MAPDAGGNSGRHRLTGCAVDAVPGEDPGYRTQRARGLKQRRTASQTWRPCRVGLASRREPGADPLSRSISTIRSSAALLSILSVLRRGRMIRRVANSPACSRTRMTEIDLRPKRYVLDFQTINDNRASPSGMRSGGCDWRSCQYPLCPADAFHGD